MHGQFRREPPIEAPGAIDGGENHAVPSKEITKQLERTYLQDVNLLLKQIEFDQADETRIRELLSHPWIEDEVVSRAADSKTPGHNIHEMLKHVLDNIDLVTIQFTKKEKALKDLGEEKEYWIDRLSDLSKVTGDTTEQVAKIKDQIGRLEEKAWEVQKSHVDLFPVVPGSDLSHPEVNKHPERNPEDDEDIDFSPAHVDTTRHTPTYQILSERGYKLPPPIDTEKRNDDEADLEELSKDAMTPVKSEPTQRAKNFIELPNDSSSNQKAA